MKKDFSLWSDAWVDVVTTTSQRLKVGLGELINSPNLYQDITAHPLVRLAVLRIMLAIEACGVHQAAQGNWRLYGTEDQPGVFQVSGLPVASARKAQDVLEMQDGNSVAWSAQTGPEAVDDAVVAQALVLAFSCDRGGLKARVPGASISGQKPTHIGELIAIPVFNHLGEFLKEHRPADAYKWVPWWERPVTFDDEFTEQVVQYFLWPWRRVEVTGDGKLIIAAGQPFKPEGENKDLWARDDWSLGKASMRHLNGLGKNEPKEGHPYYQKTLDVTAFVLNQALPIACWRFIHDPEVEAQKAAAAKAADDAKKAEAKAAKKAAKQRATAKA